MTCLERHSHEKDIQEDRLHGIVPHESTEIWIVDDTRVNTKENDEPEVSKTKFQNQNSTQQCVWC